MGGALSRLFFVPINEFLYWHFIEACKVLEATKLNFDLNYYFSIELQATATKRCSEEEYLMSVQDSSAGDRAKGNCPQGPERKVSIQ